MYICKYIEIRISTCICIHMHIYIFMCIILYVIGDGWAIDNFKVFKYFPKNWQKSTPFRKNIEIATSYIQVYIYIYAYIYIRIKS
jgi:hypothetical protein